MSNSLVTGGGAASGVAVNGRFLGRRITGVERYAREVTRRLDRRVRVLGPARAGRGVRGHLWEQSVLPARLARTDLLWSPANTGPLAFRNQVVTIHDACPLDHPEWFRPPFARWYGWILPRLARRARRVLTVSEFSRQRILELIGIPAERVVVVSPGVDRRRFRPPTAVEVREARRRHGLSNPYVLTVGSLAPRKNLRLLATAVGYLRVRNARIQLVVVGEPTHTAPTVRPPADRPWIRWLPGVTDAELPALYGGAAAFVLPSLYEGFGLPVLEAMACGAPVLVARTSALPAVVGDAGLLFDPVDADDLASRLDAVVHDGEVRRSLARRGMRRAAGFSWRRTAAGVWRTLREASA